MRTICSVIFLLCWGGASLFAQPQFEKVDAWAANAGNTHAGAVDLARQLTAPFQTDMEKARAIFYWISHNIRYDCKKFQDSDKVRFEGNSEEEVRLQKEKWEKEQIRLTLRRKKGVCEDYSRLFKAMCDSAGVEAVIIEGAGRSFYKPFRKLSKDNDHVWNAIRIDTVWHLLDVTWAAGYVDEDVTKFTADFQPGYFMTPPALFAMDHLPADEKWQLLETPVSREAFSEQPYVNFAQIAYPILDYLPKTGRLEVVDKQAEIRLKFAQTPPALLVASRNTTALPFDQTVSEDGYIILRFKTPPKGEVGVYGGEKRGKKAWLLRYYYH